MLYYILYFMKWVNMSDSGPQTSAWLASPDIGICHQQNHVVWSVFCHLQSLLLTDSLIMVSELQPKYINPNIFRIKPSEISRLFEHEMSTFSLGKVMTLAEVGMFSSFYLITCGIKWTFMRKIGMFRSLL